MTGTPRSSPPTDNGPIRVLVAEDQYLVAVDTTAILTALGYQVVACVADGRQAVDRARQGDVDVAMLDVSMPVLDGLSAAEEIGPELGVPVVLVTAYHDRALVERAMGAGVFGYLLKPVRSEQVRVSIEMALTHARRARAGRDGAQEAAQRLDEYTIAQRAKAVIFERYGVSEADAWAMLQKASRAKRVRLPELAREVIETGKLPSSPAVRKRLESCGRTPPSPK